MSYMDQLMKKKCPVCGKVFTPPVPDAWAYKMYTYAKKGRVYYCSWGCLRAAEKSGERRVHKQQATGPRVTLSKGGLLYAIAQSGMSKPRLSEKIGFSTAYLRYLLKKDPPITVREDVAEKIADACGVTLSVILKKEDST